MTKNRKARSLVKLIKKAERQQVEEPQPESSASDIPHTWSTAVRGWIRDFQQSQRTEPLPSFDGLFKNART
jgi:hypothetical protein